MKEKTKTASLKNVEFISPTGIFCCDKLLKDSKDIYNGGQDDILNFRHNCDGFVITEHNQQLYLIWIELKSSFNETTKSFGQIAYSYLKIKHHLMSFSSFTGNTEEYNEFAIVVSNSPNAQKFHQMSNEDVADRRFTIGVSHDKQATVNKYQRELRDDGRTVLRGADFGYDKLRNIQKTLVFEHLPLVHVVIDGNQGSVNLGEIIDHLQSSSKKRDML
ncbi:MAG: hypothetical protein IJ764_00360 [Bacteroidales bacterium]|nr:hypothetical protein [Bacteroidales bacterium]